MLAIVLDASEYSFEAKDSGDLIEGGKLQCVVETAEGYQAVTVPCTHGLKDKFAELPGLYDLTTTMVQKGNQVTMKVLDGRFVQAVNFGGMFKPAVAKAG